MGGRSVLGGVLQLAGAVVCVPTGLWVLSYDVGFLLGVAGGWPGVIVSLPFAPFLLLLVPVWVGFGAGEWLPFALTYGLFAPGIILVWLGRRMHTRSKDGEREDLQLTFELG